MALTQQQLEKLRQVRMFVLDMDGTIYLGESLFPFTKGFLRRVEETGRDFCFFTNNSSKNREAYLEKLARMGISLPPEKKIGRWLLFPLRQHSVRTSFSRAPVIKGAGTV